ncbi:MAG: tRNA lysidine(34) synthetase TilS [Planctomycetota bacterium]|jgi:tRNA(Ile)-lysidine synthase
MLATMPAAAPSTPHPSLRPCVDPAGAPAGALAETLRRVVPAEARLMLGVSGGSDSMALLAAAHEAVPARDRLIVAHVRHGLRDDDARDADLVATVSASLDRPCRILHAPPADPAADRSETSARRRRMAALARAAREADAHWVLLAHHLDDDLQTTLLHLLRGHRGDRALAGIPTVRPLDEHTRLLRPFLAGPSPADREALSRSRETAGLPFREDSTNSDDTVPRNRVRLWLEQADESWRTRLRGAQRAARARLQARQLAAASALESALRPEGLGCRLPIDVLLDDGGTDPDQDLAERLRLAAACLARPRRLDTRRAVLNELRRLLRSGSGGMSLPADPGPISVRASRDALHLPEEPLAPGPATARVLRAVGAGSLYL